MIQRISGAHFKDMVRKRAPIPPDLAVVKDVSATVEPVPGSRRLRFTISTAAVDRENDKVFQAGWDLVSYRRNPVVLFGHDGRSLPIGRSVQIGVEEGALKATVEFVPADVPIAGPMAEAVFRLSSGGFLPATSVGFRPLEFEPSTDKGRSDGYLPGLDFKRSELLEWSIVTIPCNPEAVIEPGQVSASTSAHAKHAEYTVAAFRGRRDITTMSLSAKMQEAMSLAARYRSGRAAGDEKQRIRLRLEQLELTEMLRVPSP